ncbi:alpha/beta fold hydrolase [Oceanithermus desulfurans]
MNHATSADGTRIAWTAEGSGPAVVLVHGITENLRVWDPVVRRLAGERTVVRLDLRGHGASERADGYGLAAMVADVIAVIEAAGVARPDVVGHSLGGLVASALGNAYPVRSVANVDQPLALAGFKAMLEPLRAPLEDPATFGPVMEQLMGQLEGERLDPAERTRLRALRRPLQEAVLGIWHDVWVLSEDDLAVLVNQLLEGYRTPYLALHGIDPGPAYVDWLAARIPGAAVEVWPDYGHYPHLVDPDRFVERLRTFWAEA